MAYVDRIYVYSGDSEESTMKVYVKLEPAGEVNIRVAIPPEFSRCIQEMAQHAADLHEAQMRASILVNQRESLKKSSHPANAGLCSSTNIGIRGALQDPALIHQRKSGFTISDPRDMMDKENAKQHRAVDDGVPHE